MTELHGIAPDYRVLLLLETPFLDDAARRGCCKPRPHGGHPPQSLPWLPAGPSSGTFLTPPASSAQPPRVNVGLCYVIKGMKQGGVHLGEGGA